MRTKHFALIPLLAILFVAARPCECGSHANGITAYSVTMGSGTCCTGTVTGVGWEHTYEPDGGGAYTLVSSRQITAQAAQDKCCPKV